MENIKLAAWETGVNAYEETDRVSIALNTIEKVEQFTKLTDTRKICEWVMKCSDYGQYKTVYTWIAPNRTSKVPLKVIIRMAIKMDIPIEEFLKKNDHASRREGTIRRHLENLNILDKYMVRNVAKRNRVKKEQASG